MFQWKNNIHSTMIHTIEKSNELQNYTEENSDISLTDISDQFLDILDDISVNLNNISNDISNDEYSDNLLDQSDGDFLNQINDIKGYVSDVVLDMSNLDKTINDISNSLDNLGSSLNDLKEAIDDSLNDLNNLENEVLLTSYLSNEIDKYTNSQEDILMNERNAYYKQDATNNMRIVYKISKIAYWLLYFILVAFFVFKKLLKFNKKYTSNFIILIVLGFYPYFIGYVYEFIIKCLKYLWNLLPKDIYSKLFF